MHEVALLTESRSINIYEIDRFRPVCIHLHVHMPGKCCWLLAVSLIIGTWQPCLFQVKKNILQDQGPKLQLFYPLLSPKQDYDFTKHSAFIVWTRTFCCLISALKCLHLPLMANQGPAFAKYPLLSTKKKKNQWYIGSLIIHFYSKIILPNTSLTANKIARAIILSNHMESTNTYLWTI